MKILLMFIACVVLHETTAATLGDYSKRRTIEGSEANVKKILDGNEFDMITKREDEREAKTFPLPDMINEGAYQGDMLLNEEQWEIINDSENNAEVGKRKAVSHLALRWPNAEVRYYVEPDVEASLGPDIDASVAYYEQHTCLDFIKFRTPPSGGYIHIQNGPGCSSSVGFLGRQQFMNLKITGCRQAIPHEFGHALGFKHEHTRPDRNSHVTVHLENVKPGKERNFNIYHQMTTYGVPYDYKSYMHYSSTAFSVNNKPTIVSKEPLDMVDLGSSKDPNFNDIKTINLMYNCNNGCPQKNCSNEGYVDKTCNCVCPDGWIGSDCSTKVPVAVDDCKNTITGGSGEITSENYPNNYPNGYLCQWLIKGTSPGQTITVNFVEFMLAGPCEFGEYIEIRKDNLFFGGDRWGDSYMIIPCPKDGKKETNNCNGTKWYCGLEGPGTHVVTSTTSPPEMLIYFRGTFTSGFRKKFKFTYCIE